MVKGSDSLIRIQGAGLRNSTDEEGVRKGSDSLIQCGQKAKKGVRLVDPIIESDPLIA